MLKNQITPAHKQRRGATLVTIPALRTYVRFIQLVTLAASTISRGETHVYYRQSN